MRHFDYKAYAISASLAISSGLSLKAQPNIVIIMTDQQRANLSKREGFPLDLTPFADSIAHTGAWFNHAYTPCPASGPARVSMLTGRFPHSTHTDSNHNIQDAVFDKDIFDVAKTAGYRTVMVGKNHSYLNKESLDSWIPYNHLGQEGKRNNRTDDNLKFDDYLKTLSFFTDLNAAPGTVENQIPYRMVTDALNWVNTNKDKPFIMWLSFPEPHNPYQVCEPYYSMFEGKIPKTETDINDLSIKGEKYTQLFKMMNLGHKGCYENMERIRTNYMGMIRLLDDQMKRFVEGMEEMGQKDSTIFIITSDHGDYAGEYGLMKKGAGLDEAITRIPMVWFGPGIEMTGLRTDFVSLVDIFPTICEFIGEEIPMGVQGRSLIDMLSGKQYPTQEFSSIISEVGFGGQFITDEDSNDYRKEGALGSGLFFDELNTWSQSGTMTMIRRDNWKYIIDMTGKVYLYDLHTDPFEIKNLYGKKKYLKISESLSAELLKWHISTFDPIPLPRSRYRYKRYKHNYHFYQ